MLLLPRGQPGRRFCSAKQKPPCPRSGGTGVAAGPGTGLGRRRACGPTSRCPRRSPGPR
ncbi:hypothetical protein CGCSCA4_v011279 [Colletotrichum siamense]|uniref:Uncharacterized protein n=1 Tax=Colletotrichum siamense TaxID=690259 RepID=A0A9P5K115_COLSI|nr:hypothetical protein CGCSCA4_v011279 [Colletotrichum siamense]KAF4853177.1 hypothetical protein CGCSCA2_v010066 [Colletotrichum siamense]